jgi:hypothetical protein
MPTRILALALVALAATAPSAFAKLPSPASMRIVPGRSIGGVRIGMDAATAVKKWGPGGSCAAAIASICTWAGTTKQGTASLEVTNGKVSNITLEAGHKANFDPVYRGPITRWKTSKGVGIGSTLRKVLRKYKRAKATGGGVELRSGSLTTFFDSSGGRVARLSIGPSQ